VKMWSETKFSDSVQIHRPQSGTFHTAAPWVVVGVVMAPTSGTAEIRHSTIMSRNFSVYRQAVLLLGHLKV
jgi:hypothetical protein